MKFVTWIAYHLEAQSVVDDYISRIARHLEGQDFVICRNLESIKREIVDADAMIGWRITPEVFAEAKQLKWIQFGSAGIDHTLFPELIASDVVLTNLSGIHTVPVSEHVFAMMLALTRRLNIAMEQQLSREYERTEIASTSDELYGKTIGIIGLGKIGLGIAKLAKAFGMQVLGTKRVPGDPLPNVDKVYKPENLDEVLQASDFIVLVIPLTTETKALIGEREIGLMKDNAYLINVARGAMLDHTALDNALRTSKLKGAALDVFPEEPLSPDSPIYDLPNTIITPHTAGSSARYWERGEQIFKRNLDAFLTDGEMINVYDRERGY